MLYALAAKSHKRVAFPADHLQSLHRTHILVHDARTLHARKPPLLRDGNFLPSAKVNHMAETRHCSCSALPTIAAAHYDFEQVPGIRHGLNVRNQTTKGSDLGAEPIFPCSCRRRCSDSVAFLPANKLHHASRWRGIAQGWQALEQAHTLSQLHVVQLTAGTLLSQVADQLLVPD